GDAAPGKPAEGAGPSQEGSRLRVGDGHGVTARAGSYADGGGEGHIASINGGCEVGGQARGVGGHNKGTAGRRRARLRPVRTARESARRSEIAEPVRERDAVPRRSGIQGGYIHDAGARS